MSHYICIVFFLHVLACFLGFQCSYCKTQAFFDTVSNVPSFYIDLGQPLFKLVIWQPCWLKLCLLFTRTIITIFLITTVKTKKLLTITHNKTFSVIYPFSVVLKICFPEAYWKGFTFFYFTLLKVQSCIYHCGKGPVTHCIKDLVTIYLYLYWRSNDTPITILKVRS